MTTRIFAREIGRRNGQSLSWQGATQDQSLPPANACQSYYTGQDPIGGTTMMLTHHERDDQADEECANFEAIGLSTGAKPPGSDKGATPTPFDVETPRVEDNRAITQMLDLSTSRAYDSALEMLGAYKLTGNFHINLEIVLKHIDAFDKVTFEVEPRSQLTYRTDCRHVLFRPRKNVPIGQFSEVIRSIKGRIGFDATIHWWARVFH